MRFALSICIQKYHNKWEVYSMNYNPSTNWALLGQKMFSDDELYAIHSASLEILEKSGAYFEEQDARDYLKAAGAEVNDETKIVKFPKWLVEDAIRSTPGRFTLAGREPSFDYVMEYGRVGYAPVGIAPAVRDLETEQSRPSVKKDLEDYARLVEQLDAIPMVWDCILPTDVPAETACLHAFEAHVKNTRKHLMTTGPNRITAKALIDMAAVVQGGEEALRARPLITGGSCPKSPLTYSRAVTACVIESSLAGVPSVGMPMVLAGATGPVTLAGTLVQHNAEVLGDIVLSQVVNKGVPFWYGSCTSIMDLRKAQCATGCAEHAMYGAAIACLARFYNIPCVAPGSWTDSKAPDMQAGYEKALSALVPAFAGANLIFGAGSLAGGMVVDFSSFVSENDLFNSIQFVLKGFDINDETMAVDLIQEIGPKGEYLTLPHTMQHMRDNQMWPAIFNRDVESSWIAEGSKDLDQVAMEKARELIAKPNPAPLNDSVQKQLANIIEETERELGVG